MSYCVNCGVELTPSLKSCPLCHVPVINPAQPWKEPRTSPYPNRVESILKTIDRRYGALLMSVALSIPVVCSGLIDLLITHRLSWSGYVTGAAICVFLWVLFPLLIKKPILYLHLALDFVALEFYLADIFFVNKNMQGYYEFAMPLGVAVALFAFACALVIRSERLRHKLYKPALIIILTAMLTVAVELIIDLGISGVFQPLWSLIAAAPLLLTSLMLFILERKKKLKDKIERRLFM